MTKFLQYFLWVLFAGPVYAAPVNATSMNQSVPYQLQVVNPAQTMLYTVGDVFTRTLNLSVKRPYTLSLASIPVKGTVYQGAELQRVDVETSPSADSMHYRIQLQYQIFTSAATVKKIKLEKHALSINHAGKIYRPYIPSWELNVSPLAASGEVDIEQEMSPFRPPLLVDTERTQALLAGFLCLSLLCISGLIYINADNSWFPGMGGPFAQSYRQLSLLNPNATDRESLQKAALMIQHAFNKTSGESLFASDISDFINKYPRFSNIEQQLHGFFQISDHVLFNVNQLPSITSESESENDKVENRELTHQALSGVSVASLVHFCEQCRHCERSVA